MPTAVMVEASKGLEAIAGEVNKQMRAALRHLLSSKGEHATPEDIRRTIARIARVSATTATEANGLALATAKSIERFNRRDIRRTLGINVPEFSAPIGERWRSDYIARIKGLSEDSRDRFAGILREANQKQTRVETLARALEEQLEITSRRARFLARDSVLSLNAKLTEDRHQRAGIEEYEWVTMGDGSVRSNHSHLNGKRFRYDQPPMGGGSGPNDRGNPGTGRGCRCQGIPVIPEFEESKPEKRTDAVEPSRSLLTLNATAFLTLLSRYRRIGIVGAPKAGKTTLTALVTDRPVIHTDDWIDAGWADAPLKVIEAITSPDAPFVVEGVIVPRAVRKGLQLDALLFLPTPLAQLNARQVAMVIAQLTVLESMSPRPLVFTTAAPGTLPHWIRVL